MMPRRTCPKAGEPARHDTAALPLGDFYFAPGAIEHAPRRKRLRLSAEVVELVARAVLIFAACGALAAAIGFSAGWLTMRGLL